MHYPTKLALCMVAMSCQVAMAKTCVWTGSGELDAYGQRKASDPANWADEAVPETGDTVEMTVKDAYGINVDIPAVTLEKFVYVNPVGSSLSGSISISGEGSRIEASNATVYLYATLTLAETAKCVFSCNGASVVVVPNGVVNGSGEVSTTGTGTLYLNGSNDSFDGVWRIENDEGVVVQGESVNPFGSESCTVYLEKWMKGQKDLCFKNAFYIPSRVGCRANGILRFDGDVHCVARTSWDDIEFNSYPATEPSYKEAGFVFNGNFTVDLSEGTNVGPYFANYGSGSGARIEFNGPKTDLGNVFVRTDMGGKGCLISVGGPVTTKDWQLFYLRNNFKVQTTAPNVLPVGVVFIGAEGADTHGVVFDLQGNDQYTGAIANYWDAGRVNDSVITSSKGPALWRANGYWDVSTRKMPYISGELSFKLCGWNEGSYYFPAGGDTTGWIASEQIGLDFSGAKFPNLAGVEMSQCVVMTVDEDTQLNSDMCIDFHGRSTGAVRVKTGSNLTVRHAVIEYVDLPAGVYCPTGAGVSGATEVDWLGGADGYAGTVTVAEHDPLWVWTGKGDGTTLVSAENWGCNLSPDLADPKLVMDFGHAAPNTTITLTGNVAPAGTISFGAYTKNKVSFAGEGSLAIAGTGDQVFTASFAGNASLTYAGTGTLTIKDGSSSSLGTLTVASGKVVLDASSWVGKVAVAPGAELEVVGNCGSNVFGAPNDNRCRFDLKGRLVLAEGIDARIKCLVINGTLARRNKTYGSSASEAECVDDVHFSGKGTISSMARMGLLVGIR